MKAILDASGFPTYAHIPGSNPRHREDLFDEICASVTPDMTVSDLSKTSAWQSGLDLYRHGYFWEAHEVLEAVWMQCPQNSVERYFVQAIIQITNARLKLIMKRPKAAGRLFDKASTLFHEAGLQSDRPILETPLAFVEIELQTLDTLLEPVIISKNMEI
ncbi:MAG: DUF309 domain-containing protein [Rhizobiaceae bacterium]|nr:DUF309 domain-containing protein [Rhizobiaceae bacterium]